MRTLTALAAVLALAGSARATVQADLSGVEAMSQTAAGAGSIEGLKGGGMYAFSETTGGSAVAAGTRAATSAAPAETAATTPAKQPTLTVAQVPPPGKGVLQKTGDALKKAGDAVKPYVPHMLAAGVGAGAGLVAAQAAGLGLLGGALMGGAIGLGAFMLFQHGQTGAAIGAASFGIAGLALGGPVGGLVGAVVGGLGAWMLGKFFATDS